MFEHELPGPHSASAERVLSIVSARNTLRSRRRKRAKALALAAALLAVAASVYMIRGATQTNGAVCFDAPDVASDFVVAVPAPGGQIVPEICVPLWRDGSVSASDIDVSVGGPELLGCVADDGRLLVFPTGDRSLCERLGLDSFDDDAPMEADRAEVAQELAMLFGSGRCISLGEAILAIESLLTEIEGGDTWQLDVSPMIQERPCASYALDADRRRITLVGIPRTDGN